MSDLADMRKEIGLLAIANGYEGAPGTAIVNSTRILTPVPQRAYFHEFSTPMGIDFTQVPLGLHHATNAGIN